MPKTRPQQPCSVVFAQGFYSSQAFPGPCFKLYDTSNMQGLEGCRVAAVSEGFFVSLTHGRDDPERTTVALTMAVTAAASGKTTYWFLTMGGVEWSQVGSMEGVAVPGLTPLAELYEQFRELGGKVWVCTPCFKRRSLDESSLLPEAELVGGATVVELLSQGVPALSY